MKKLSFDEWLQLRTEYNEYLSGEPQPAEPEAPAQPEEPEAPAQPEEPEEPEADPMADVKKEIDDIKKAMAFMGKALQPSLGDIKPVGIDDVVSKFFNE